MKKNSYNRQTLVMGKNCIAELIRHHPDRLVKIMTAKAEPWNHDELLAAASKAGIPIAKVDKQTLNSLVQSESHQSYVAEIKPRRHLILKEFLQNLGQKNRALVLALDSIQDPQNVGALLRAAECFGVDAVLWSKNRGPSITPVVSKAGVGASELVPIIEVSNLVESCRRFKEEGFWLVTAEVGKESTALPQFDFPELTILAVGGEGAGIQNLLSREADFRVYIPMFGKIDSLNVSQATAVILSSWRAQNSLTP